jgi:hypothetical protein
MPLTYARMSPPSTQTTVSRERPIQ